MIEFGIGCQWQDKEKGLLIKVALYCFLYSFCFQGWIFQAVSVGLQQKALEAAMTDINSSFGKGSVTRLGSAGGALV
jgi:hypothetical protein